MLQRFGWTALTMGVAGGILALASRHAQTWSAAGYGVAYFLFGVALLGTVARWWVQGSPAVWRPTMLSIGALAAAGEIGWRAGGVPVPIPVEQWMTALLGLVAAALSARLLPYRIVRLWLGVERRVHEPGA
jgi:hypothetical protein